MPPRPTPSDIARTVLAAPTCETYKRHARTVAALHDLTGGDADHELWNGVLSAPEMAAAVAQHHVAALPLETQRRFALAADTMLLLRVSHAVGRIVQACAVLGVEPAELDPETLAVVALAWPESALPDEVFE